MSVNFITVDLNVVSINNIEVGKSILFRKKPAIIIQIMSTRIKYGKFFIRCLIQTAPMAYKSLPQTVYEDIPIKLASNTSEVSTGIIVNGSGFPYKIVDITDLSVDTLNYNVRIKMTRVRTFDSREFARITASQQVKTLGWHVV